MCLGGRETWGEHEHNLQDGDGQGVTLLHSTGGHWGTAGFFLSQQHLPFVPGCSPGASSLLFAVEAGCQYPAIDSFNERKRKCISVVWVFPSAQGMCASCPDKKLLPLVYFWNRKTQYSIDLWSKHSWEKLEFKVQVSALNHTRNLNPSLVKTNAKSSQI